MQKFVANGYNVYRSLKCQKRKFEKFKKSLSSSQQCS